MRNVLGFIPARGGSKGVKDKNIKLLNGKPLISYTIEQAFESEIFEDIIVSTDSEKIAQISKKYGASVPFVRPKELAKDNSPLFKEKKADFVVSICECEHSPLLTNTIGDDLNIDNFIKDEIKNRRRQDLPKHYRLNGAIYIAKVDKLLEDKSFFGKNNYAYIMDRKNSIDIDSIDDFKLAEFCLGEGGL